MPCNCCQIENDTFGEEQAKAAGYIFIRIEGYVFSDQVSGTVSLKLYFDFNSIDNFLTATSEGEAQARNAGYEYIRTEGYVCP